MAFVGRNLIKNVKFSKTNISPEALDVHEVSFQFYAHPDFGGIEGRKILRNLRLTFDWHYIGEVR